MLLYVRNSEGFRKLVVTASSFVTVTVRLLQPPFVCYSHRSFVNSVTGAVLLNVCVLDSICCGLMRCSQQYYHHHHHHGLPDAIYHCVGASF